MSTSARNGSAPPIPGVPDAKWTVSAFSDGAKRERVPATALVPAAAARVPMKLRRPIAAPLLDFFVSFDFLFIITPHTYANYGASLARNALDCKAYAENSIHYLGCSGGTLFGKSCFSKSRNHSRNRETCAKNYNCDVYGEHCLRLNRI